MPIVKGITFAFGCYNADQNTHHLNITVSINFNNPSLWQENEIKGLVDEIHSHISPKLESEQQKVIVTHADPETI